MYDEIITSDFVLKTSSRFSSNTHTHLHSQIKSCCSKWLIIFLQCTKLCICTKMMPETAKQDDTQNAALLPHRYKTFFMFCWWEKPSFRVKKFPLNGFLFTVRAWKDAASSFKMNLLLPQCFKASALSNSSHNINISDRKIESCCKGENSRTRWLGAAFTSLLRLGHHSIRKPVEEDTTMKMSDDRSGCVWSLLRDRDHWSDFSLELH